MNVYHLSTWETFGNIVVGIVSIHETAVDIMVSFPRPPNVHVYFACFPYTGFYTDPVPVTGYRRNSNFAVTKFSEENSDEQNKLNSPRTQIQKINQIALSIKYRKMCIAIRQGRSAYLN